MLRACVLFGLAGYIGCGLSVYSLPSRCQEADDLRGWRIRYYATELGLVFRDMLFDHVHNTCPRCQRRMRMMAELARVAVMLEMEVDILLEEDAQLLR